LEKLLIAMKVEITSFSKKEAKAIKVKRY